MKRERKEREMACHACGSASVVTNSRSLPQRIGRYKVTNQFGHISRCVDCEEWTVESSELERLELQAVVVTFHDAEIENLAGAELRDARKALGLTRGGLAAALGKSAQTVSRWENDHDRLPEWIKPAITGMATSRGLRRVSHSR